MAGIIFLKTRRLEEIRRFYESEIGMDIWLEQADCVILKHGNLLLGFCHREEADLQGMITFYFDTNEEVDSFYEVFSESADGPPRNNPKYDIYHFFCKDPEGRAVEFQRFLSDVRSPC